MGVKFHQQLVLLSSCKISMPFDLIEFNGGLKAVGVLSKTVHGVQHYKINHYQDLNHLLGSCWHFRGLNVNGDYGYVLLDTVDFSLRKARSLVEYFPPISDNQSVPPQPHHELECLEEEMEH